MTGASSVIKKKTLKSRHTSHLTNFTLITIGGKNRKEQIRRIHINDNNSILDNFVVMKRNKLYIQVLIIL